MSEHAVHPMADVKDAVYPDVEPTTVEGRNAVARYLLAKSAFDAVHEAYRNAQRELMLPSPAGAVDHFVAARDAEAAANALVFSAIRSAALAGVRIRI